MLGSKNQGLHPIQAKVVVGHIQALQMLPVLPDINQSSSKTN
jgi:hypothetical protein